MWICLYLVQKIQEFSENNLSRSKKLININYEKFFRKFESERKKLINLSARSLVGKSNFDLENLEKIYIKLRINFKKKELRKLKKN